MKKLCYNFDMKIIVRLFLLILLFLQSQVYAKTFDVLVIPVDLLSTKQNYYGFEEVSEIIANDIITDFSKGACIKSPDLYTVRQKFYSNPNLRNTASHIFDKYKNTGTIDYNGFKLLSEAFKCNSVLIISGYAMTSNNNLKRSLWDILDLASVSGNIINLFLLETHAVLLDNVNDIIMWSGNYYKKAGNNDYVYSASNYAEAEAYLENIRLYSSSIVAKDVSQNVTLRFFPKTIRPIDNKYEKNTNGDVLRFEKNIPVLPRTDKNPQESEKDNYGEMLFGI